MGGFVVFEQDRAWGASNAAWRAAVTPAAEFLPEGSPGRVHIDGAAHGAIHYLDLTGAPPAVLAEIRSALAEVLGQYERGERTWGDERETASFLELVRGLIAMFDDPEMGRLLWPDPERFRGGRRGRS